MAPLSAAEIAAYIGAAAWVPQIVTWVYNKYITPNVMIIPEPQVELGFTTYGPIFNIRLALSVERKDAIIDGVKVLLRHENGEVHSLSWTGMRETFSEITDSAGNRQLIEKDQPAIAIKLSTLGLVEKFVRFHELEFHNKCRIALNDVIDHFNYLKKTKTDYRELLLESKLFFDMIELYKSCFWWKPGRYFINFDIHSPNKTTLQENKLSFFLSQHDTDSLRQNLDLLRDVHENLIKADLPDYQPKTVLWTWRNIVISHA